MPTATSARWISGCSGDLHIDQSFGASVPWPLARWTFTPLGYRPEPDGYRIVPQYSPGLPLLMAAFKLAAGQCAIFWVVPVCGGILVFATYAIGRRLGRPIVGLAAAWIVATSPTLLFMLMAPMSDVPAAAAWAVSVAFALGRNAAGGVCGGPRRRSRNPHPSQPRAAGGRHRGLDGLARQGGARAGPVEIRAAVVCDCGGNRRDRGCASSTRVSTDRRWPLATT